MNGNDERMNARDPRMKPGDPRVNKCHLMETLARRRYHDLFRVVTAAVALAVLGFVCGYFGPLYLREDAGVGPITGFFAGPVGAVIGAATAIRTVLARNTARQFAYSILMVAALFAVAVVLLVIVQ